MIPFLNMVSEPIHWRRKNVQLQWQCFQHQGSRTSRHRQRWKMSSITRPPPLHSTSDLKLYTIMSCDTLGLLLSHIKLKTNNYEQCATSILTCMRGKKKEYFIDGSMKRPCVTLLNWPTGLRWSHSSYNGFSILLMHPSSILFLTWHMQRIYETTWKNIFLPGMDCRFTN